MTFSVQYEEDECQKITGRDLIIFIFLWGVGEEYIVVLLLHVQETEHP